MTVIQNTMTPELFLELYQCIDWAVCLELNSSKEPFCEQFGFEQRPWDWDGSGMFKMLRK